MPADTTRELIADEIETTDIETRDREGDAPKGRASSIVSGLARRKWLIGGAAVAFVALT